MRTTPHEPEPVVPASHLDLLERPLFAHVSTVRPDGLIQSNPMWFAWDGSVMRLTTSTPRQKFRNVGHDDRVSVSVHDPDQPYRYLELRGRLVEVEPDAQGVFFDFLADRYSFEVGSLPDRPQRVVLVVEPVQASWQ